MLESTKNYLSELVERFGNGWNEFWFRPSDPLILGLMRLLSGLVALYVVGSYSFDLVVFFGPQGILPPEFVQQLRDPNELRFSYLTYFRQPGELLAAHIIGMAIVGLFTIGLWTRVTSVLAWLVVLSYIQRAPMIVSHVEQVLVFVMFYLCLGPAGKAYSVDALRAKRQAPAAPPDRESVRFFSATIVTRLIQVHLATVYLMMGISKLAGVEGVESLAWWRGEAVWWLMVRPDTRLIDLSGYFAKHPYLVNAWTHAIVVFELAFAVLIWNRLARPLLLALAVPMWLSLALISGLLPLACMMLIANLAFVSPDFVRSLQQRPATAVA